MADIVETMPPVLTGEAMPRASRPEQKPASSASRKPPAIYAVPSGSVAGRVQRAAALGFNYLLLPAGDDLPVAAARKNGIGLLRDLSLSGVVEDPALLAAHPDWFVHSGADAAFRYLGETDATVDWWDARIASWQEAGIGGFRCVAAQRIQAPVWVRLMAAARARDAAVVFIAEMFGATPDEIAAFRDAGFDYVFCSSCWWDFSAAWLNEDAARMGAVAKLIALAAPPGVKGWSETARVRALRLAAMYGAGWMMEAGFCAGQGFDLSDEVKALNALRRRFGNVEAGAAQVVSSAGAAVAVLARGDFVVAVNASLTAPADVQGCQVLPLLDHARLELVDGGEVVTPERRITLAAGEALRFTAPPNVNVFAPAAIALNTDAPRIAIEAMTPQVDDGRFPVRRIVGEMLAVEADIIADGHDKLAAAVLLRAADEMQWRMVPMQLINNDRWGARISLQRMGRHVFIVQAWKDVFATFADELKKKRDANVPTSLEIREGILLLEEAAVRHVKLQAVVEQLRAASEDTQRQTLLSDEMAAMMRDADEKKFAVVSHQVTVDAERKAAAFASWYEIFPRSQSGDVTRHGTFQDVIRQLPRIAEMGFDVLYFPPIHPIGAVNRKGRNNTLTPAADDPGSPYAIGSAAGGHDAIHPELGTLADFHALRDAAAAKNIELALDFAIQCAPDHPWLKEHPEWFDWRPDGSLRYAENPPKKYEDIINVDFYAEGARPSLWRALRDVVQFWVDQGVKLFRVDNPHTKPLPFWEWMIADIRSRHPDTVFLAEAFTRPKAMYRLAKIGFSQSYTYFTWRNAKWEFEDYLTELTTTAPKDFFRPHFFVNTPDINPVFLQNSGRPGFLIRAVLAATLSGLWGVYNGFELCEAAAVPGKEEYFESEKYEIKAWDYDRPGNIVAEIAQLNRIRRSNAALHSHLGVAFLPCDNANVLYFSKTAADGNVVLVAVSLDPFNMQDTRIELPLWRFGLADDGALAAEDLMRDFKFVWRGKYQDVRLNPAEQPFCIWRVSPVRS